MKGSSFFDRILLYRGVVDFRKWISGLAIIVEHEIQENLMDERCLFVFLSRDSRSIKALYWNRTGLALWTTRLESEKFKIGRNREGKCEVSREQFEWILAGYDYTKMTPHKEVKVKKLT